MAKRLNYEIGFSADTTQLRQAVNVAQQELQKISSFSTGGALTQDMMKAAQAAQQLSLYLKQATDETTGKLDLSKFNAALSTSQTKFSDYAARLRAIGPEGERAFLNVASAISKAELPIMRSSKLLDGLWTTMKNTIRWQLTSSMLHGFMGGLKTCYGYAQDLNSSLNNIRIVTGSSAEEMAEFAKQANKAAKELSSTTTSYTDAALIYYQQGLSDKEVKGRTNTTIKLSNVTRQSAEEVSNQMTAIWNNFYDGSKSLEYYADVITELGAKTASSSSEIAAGLEKFAAVAGTVGLSYEYATAALTTVTATTRQSADIVGNAFKTLFARIQGLSLGETLDDGTDLNKYSKALESVGVNIKDVNGDLKDMDVILEETAARWQNLSKDQQMALAQTVAGVRQYTQFVALMDNWDFMQTNLQTVAGSAGSLQKQADIYAESWEAARDRVRAAAEDIYDSIINPDTFISVDNALTPFLTGIANIIDALGGLKGTLIATGYITTTLYGDKFAQMLRDAAYNVATLTGKELERQRILKQEVADMAANMAGDPNNLDMLGLSETNIQAQKVSLQVELNEKAKELSTIQREQLENEIEFVGALGQATSGYAKQAAEAAKASDDIAMQIALSDKTLSSVGDNAATIIYAQLKRKWEQIAKPLNMQKLFTLTDSRDFTLDEMLNSIRNVNEEIGKLSGLKTQIAGISGELSNSVDPASQLAQSFEQITGQGLEGLSKDQALELLNERLEAAQQGAQLLNDAMNNFQVPAEAIRQFAESCQQAGMTEQQAAIATENYAKSYAELQEAIRNAQIGVTGWSEIVVGVARNMATLGMAMRSIQNIGNILSNEDLTTGEKLIQILTSMTMLIPLVTTITKAYRNTQAMLATTSATAGAGQGFFASMVTAAGAAAAGATGPVTAFAAAVNAIIWPLTLIVMIAGAAVAAIMAIVNAVEKQRQAEIDARRESYENTKAELAEQQDLIDAYNKALETYQETGEGKAELFSAALEVAEALGVEGAAVANLTGNYEELNAKIAETQKSINAQTLVNAKSQKGDLGDAFVKSMRKGVGNVNIFDGKYRADMGSTYTSEASKQNQALESSEFFQNYGQKSTRSYDTVDDLGNTIGTTTTNDYSLQAASGSAEELVKMYEQAEAALVSMREAQLESGEAAGTVYKNLEAWVNKSRETYEAYRALLDEIQSASFQTALDEVGRGEAVSSLAGYIDYEKQLTEAVHRRVEAGEIEASKERSLVDTYLKSADSLHKYALEYELLTQISKKYGKEGTDLANNAKIQEAIDQMSEQDLQMMINIVPSASSITEFQNILETQITEAAGLAAQESMNAVAEIMDKLNSNMAIDDKMKEALSGDSNFMSALRQDFESFDDFLIQSRQTQIEFIRDYYTAISQFAVENLTEQTRLAEEERDIEQTKYNALSKLVADHSDLVNEMDAARAAYTEAKSDEEREAILSNWKRIQGEISKQVGFEVSFDIDDSDSLDTLNDKLSDIEKRIKDINRQKIEIAITWDDFDDLKGQFDQVANFAQIMMKDAKQVGENYQYPIDKVREWMDVYPDLFAQAQVTNEGLIAINQEEVNDYIEGLNAETDANALSKIEQWKLEKQDLEVQRAALQAELKAFTNAENAKIKTKNLSAEQIATLVQELTNYQIKCGVDEATAHTKALDAMGLNEQEFSRIVAEVSKTNADNMANSVAAGAKAGSETLQKYSFSWKNLAHNVLEVAKAIGAALTGKEFTVNFKDIIQVSGSSANFSGSNVQSDFQDVDPEEQDPIEAFKTKKIKKLTADLSAIDNAIANIDAKILAAQALENAPAWEGSYGSTEESGGSKKNGSSSSGSKAKKDLKDIKEELKEVLERYHEISREIEYHEKLLKKIETQIDRTYGKDKLSLYKKQREELEKLAKLQKSKSDAALLFVGSDAQTLKDLGLSPDIDQDSLDIKNYTALLDQATADYNAAIEAYKAYQSGEEYAKLLEEYNSLTNQDETKEVLEEKMKEIEKGAEEAKEEAENLYQKRTKALQTYEDSVDTYREELEKHEEYLRRIEDSRLQEITDTIKLKIDFKDAKKEVRDLAKLIQETIGTSLDHGVKVMLLDYQSMLDEKGMLGDYRQEYESLMQLVEESKTNEYIDQEALAAELDNLRDKIIGSAEALIEWAEALEDKVPDAIDDARKSFDQYIETLEHGVTVLETVQEIMSLQGINIYTSQGYEDMMGLYDQIQRQYVSQAQLNKQYMERAKAELEKAQAKLDAATQGTQEYDILKAGRDALLKEFQDTQKAYLQASLSAMQTAQKKYEDQVDSFVKELEMKLTNGLGFAEVKDKYDYYLDYQETYLDPIEQINELTKMETKLQREYDKASNDAARNRIKALQDEYAQLAKNNKLSEYDIELMNAKIEATLKQSEMEDALNSKTTLRLTRDSQGNFTYQYTADEDNINKAKEEYQDAWMNVYEMSQEYSNKIYGNMMDLQEKLTEKLREIALDQTLTEEQKIAKMEQVYEEYGVRYNELNEELMKSARGMNEGGTAIIEEFREKVKTEMGTAGSAVGGFANTANQLSPTIRPGLDAVIDDANAMMEGVTGKFSGINSYLNETFNPGLDGNLETALGFLSTFVGDDSTGAIGAGNTLRDKYNDILGYIAGSTDDFNTLFNGEMNEDFKNAIGDGISHIHGFGTSFNETLDNIGVDLGTFGEAYDENIDGIGGSTEDFTETVREAVSDLEDAVREHGDNIAEINADTGTSYEDLKDIMDEVAQTNEEVTERGQEEIEMMWEKIGEIESATWAYAEMADSIRDAAEAMRDLAAATMEAQFNRLGGQPELNEQDLKAKYGNLDYSHLIANAIENGDLVYGSDTYNSLMGQRAEAFDTRGGADKGWKTNEELDAIFKDSDSRANSEWYNNTAGSTYEGPYANNQYSFDEWLRLLGISSMSTGGYTGDFENGKLGILHEKELVLNQRDTENILSAVQLMRGLSTNIWENIAQVLDSTIAASRQFMAGMLANSGAYAPVERGQDEITQYVEINADFSGVERAAEIREALSNLTNDAAQYVHQT